MNEGRNLDEELEAQLAGAAIPEDEVDFMEDNAPSMNTPSTNAVWALIPSATEPSTVSESINQGKFASNAKKFSVRLLDPSLDLCLKTVGEGSSLCVAVGCKVNHAGNPVPLKLEHAVIVIMKQKDKAFADLTLEGRLVPDEVMKRWEETTRTFYDWHEAFLAMEQQDDERVVGETDFEDRVLEVQ
jgi:hypothetical protein